MPHPTTYPSEFKSPHNANAIEQLDFSDCLENYSRAGFNQKAFEFEFEAHTNRTDTHSLHQQISIHNCAAREHATISIFYFLFSYRELFFYFSISPFLCAVPRGVWAINLHRVRHALLQLFKRPLHQFRIEIGVLGYRDVLYEEGSQLRSQASG